MVRVLRNLKINEVSSVDKGAGEGVKVMFWKRDESEPYWKRDFTQQQRDDAAQSGAAMPDGSFPIKTGGDLENAVRAIGRASDPAAAKKHIISRARALGMTDKLPTDWNVSKAMQESEMTDDEIKALVSKAAGDAVTAATKPLLDEISTLKRDNVLLKMSSTHKAYMDGCDAATQKSFGDMTDAQRDAFMAANPLKKRDEPVVASDLAKRDEVAKRLETENADLRKRLDQMDLEKAQADFKKRAADIGLKAEGDGEIMRKAYGGDKEAQAAFEKRQGEARKGLEEQVRSGKLFEEFGSSKGGETDAYKKLQSMADEEYETVRKSGGKKITKEQAFDKVWNDPANAALREEAKASQMTHA